MFSETTTAERANLRIKYNTTTDIISHSFL